MGFDAACPEPARQPETIPAGLEGNCNAFDLASCFLRFLTPAIEKLQQCALVDRELLQRLALDARHDAGNEPARQAHFDHRDQCTVLFQDDTRLAQVVRRLHWGLHRFTSATMDAISSPPPHSIFLTGLFARAARGRAIAWSFRAAPTGPAFGRPDDWLRTEPGIRTDSRFARRRARL